MCSTPSGTLIRLRRVQYLNVPTSSRFSVEGSLTFSTALPENVHPSHSSPSIISFSPTFSSPSFSQTVFSYLQSSNALAPISLTLGGRMSASIPLSEKQ